MKKYALFAAAALVALAACSKNEVKPQTPETPVDDDSPVAVQFGVASASASIDTRSVGPVDDKWNGKQKLYVYSFAKAAAPLDYTAAEAFIDNIAADSPASGTSGKIEVLNPYPKGDTSEGQTPEPFYYNNDLIYDFYGYHMDDAWATGDTPDDYTIANPLQPQAPEPETDRIYVRFLINGSQDLMIAKADPSVDFPNATDNEFKGDPNNVQYVYSAYAARRGVQPTLKFEHLLARFNFSVVSGGADADDVMVESVAIESRYKGNLVVVANTTGTDPDIVDPRGLADLSENTTKLFLQQYKDNGELEAFKAFQVPTYVSDGANTAQPIGNGASILAVPGVASYWLTVQLKYNEAASATNTTPIDAIHMELKAEELKNGEDSANATEFEAGKEYNVTIRVIGPKKVEITADLKPWEDGGSVTIDPDDKPELPSAGQGN